MLPPPVNPPRRRPRPRSRSCVFNVVPNQNPERMKENSPGLRGTSYPGNPRPNANSLSPSDGERDRVRGFSQFQIFPFRPTPRHHSKSLAKNSPPCFHMLMAAGESTIITDPGTDALPFPISPMNSTLILYEKGPY